MRNKWIRFGCFLTGMNYDVIQSCSELAKKRVIKYCSALLILCVIWMFVGFMFTERYLHGSVYTCLFAAVLMTLLVIQIERQIILTRKSSLRISLVRGGMAIAMAIIGAIIVDQTMLKDDIDRQKQENLPAEVNHLFDQQSIELKKMIENTKVMIKEKDMERKNILEDLDKHPFVWTAIVVEDGSKDSTGRPIKKIHRSQVTNPKNGLIQATDSTIASMVKQNIARENQLLTLKDEIEKKLTNAGGILGELEIVYSLLMKSWISLGFYLLWFSILFFMEIFILLSKSKEEENDYDRRMQQQMDLHYRRIELMNQKALP